MRPTSTPSSRCRPRATGSIGRRSRGPKPPRRDRPNAYFELATPVRARFIRYVHGHVGAANLAISDIRVFGNADGRAPATSRRAHRVRHSDQRDATIRWARVAGAVGYNIRFGIRPDRLTLTHQLWADELGNGATLPKELRSLNVGVPYYVAVEAFNESGVSKLSRVLPRPLASQPPVKPASSRPRWIAGTRRM